MCISNYCAHSVWCETDRKTFSHIVVTSHVAKVLTAHYFLFICLCLHASFKIDLCCASEMYFGSLQT